MCKRLFDIIFSLLGIIILSPLFLIIAILIKRDSRGPIFYKGERVGKDGKLFKIYKFRTMREDADKISSNPSCADDDPRITKFGKFLRKYKLNELPQLINVLKGEMSFVGPRPEVKFYIDMLSDEEKKEILSVRPGITDWASLWNPDEGKVLAEASARGEDPEKYYAEKIRPTKIKLQLEYVKNHSFWVDLKILFETVKVLFK
jgi:lipopolysaccharide/colanic/teichoic acid biosynthesis glycosyltransferase